MPDESKEEDSGWLPGPVDRVLPAFTGRTPGPADPTLSAASIEREIMARLLTDQVVGTIADFGRQHAQHYRSADLQMDSDKELTALNDTIESAMDWECTNLNGDSVRVWIAAKLRVACLSEAEAVNELARVFDEVARAPAYSLRLFCAHTKDLRLFAMPLLYSPTRLLSRILRIMMRL